MATLTIKHRDDEITLPWGANYDYKRVPGSVTIVIGCVGGTLPQSGGSALAKGSIGVEFDVCPDGSINLRGTGIGDGNSYMHIVTSDGPPTDAQVTALKSRPFGAGAGRSVIAWASGEDAAKKAARYHD